MSIWSGIVVGLSALARLQRSRWALHTIGPGDRALLVRPDDNLVVEDAVADRFPDVLVYGTDRQFHGWETVDGSLWYLPFDPDSFDFAHAGSVIEHLQDRGLQRAFVGELTRVAKSWVISTPSRWGFVEPHTRAVLAHWLPAWRRRHPDLHLLSRREFVAMLPESAVVVGSWWSPTLTAIYSRRPGDMQDTSAGRIRRGAYAFSE